MGSANKLLKKQIENKTLLIWKMAAASALSWEISKLAGSDHPYLAPLSVILCLQTTINRSIKFSYHRMVGTVIGIVVTIIASPYIPVNAWTLGLLILLGCFLAKWLKRDESVIHQVALTVLLVFVMEQKSGDYFFDRFRDTLIGAIVAVILHMFFYPPNFTKQVSKSFNRFEYQLISSFLKVSGWIDSGLNDKDGHSLQVEVKELLQELVETTELLNAAFDSLKYNPLGKRSKIELQQYRQRTYYIIKGWTYLSSIINTFMAWSASTTISSAQISTWAEQVRVLSAYLKAKVHPAEFSQPENILKVTIPKQMEIQKYPIALYNETTELLKILNDVPRNV